MQKIKNIIHWSLLFLLIIYLLTGLGVSYYQFFEVISLGLFSKIVSSKIHDLLIFIFVPFLFLHIYYKFKK